MIIRKIVSITLALVMLCGVFAYVSFGAGDTGGASSADWNYTLDDDAGTITLTKYVGSAQTVEVPDSFEIDGTTYGTVLACGTVFRANTNVRSVTIGGGVSFLNNSMRLLFGECSALTAVDLSEADTSGVTDMSYMFYNCGALKAVDLSSFDTSNVTTIRGMFSCCTHLSGLTGYENWNTSSLKNMYQTFNKVAYSLSASTQVTIDLSRWDLDQVTNTGWCFQMCRAQNILVPENIAVMSAGFMNHAIRLAGSTYTIPSGVKKIGYAHTFYDFATNDFTTFYVDPGNTAYQAIDGVLYSGDGREMLAVPRNKPFENGVFEIPEGVDFLAELSFSRNYNIHTVILPDTYEIEYVPVYDGRYIVYNDTGNLNAGTNLSIAIYCYTGITDYAVKETNPRYASVDGVIYSKDMTRIIAVPARYNKAINVPEGVTRWEREAMWADGSDTVDNLLANCSGVSLPSTLTYMSSDQLEMLNRLHANRANGTNPFTIALDGDNTGFRLDGDGFLHPNYTVSVTADPVEGGTVTGGGEYCEGADVTLVAEAAEGFYFKEWRVTSGGVTIANDQFTMPAENVEISAVFEAIVPGDVDGDGRVNGTDLAVAKKYIAGVIGEGDIVFANADLNSDGKVNGKDFNLIKKCVAGSFSNASSATISRSQVRFASNSTATFPSGLGSRARMSTAGSYS